MSLWGPGPGAGPGLVWGSRGSLDVSSVRRRRLERPFPLFTLLSESSRCCLAPPSRPGRPGRFWACGVGRKCRDLTPSPCPCPGRSRALAAAAPSANAQRRRGATSRIGSCVSWWGGGGGEPRLSTGEQRGLLWRPGPGAFAGGHGRHTWGSQAAEGVRWSPRPSGCHF